MASDWTCRCIHVGPHNLAKSVIIHKNHKNLQNCTFVSVGFERRHGSGSRCHQQRRLGYCYHQCSDCRCRCWYLQGWCRNKGLSNQWIQHTKMFKLMELFDWAELRIQGWVVQVIYQTQETVFHRDIQTLRTELKIWCAVEYFWQNLRCLDSTKNTVSSVWYIFSIETKAKE